MILTDNELNRVKLLVGSKLGTKTHFLIQHGDHLNEGHVFKSK